MPLPTITEELEKSQEYTEQPTSLAILTEDLNKPPPVIKCSAFLNLLYKFFKKER